MLARLHHGHHQTAVTGNFLVGRARLPHRDEPPGWEALNSVIRL